MVQDKTLQELARITLETGDKALFVHLIRTAGSSYDVVWRQSEVDLRFLQTLYESPGILTSRC